MKIDKDELRKVLEKHDVSEADKLSTALAEFLSDKILSIDEIDKKLGQKFSGF